MRVEGNGKPEQVHVEAFGPCPGMMELRLRENVIETGENGMFRYDEYVLRVADRPGLKEEVEQNLEDWLATARTMEDGENSSALANVRHALNLMVPGEKLGRELEMAQVFYDQIRTALRLVYDALNQGQQQKLLKQDQVKAMFQHFAVEETL